MKYDVTIASVPDRDQLVAEIWIEGILFGEVRTDALNTYVELYSRPDGKPWTFECDRLSIILSEAKTKLLSG